MHNIYLERLQIANPATGHFAGGYGMRSSLPFSLAVHQIHNPPTPALANFLSLTHDQILFNPNQPTDLEFSNIPVIRP